MTRKYSLADACRAARKIAGEDVVLDTHMEDADFYQFITAEPDHQAWVTGCTVLHETTGTSARDVFTAVRQYEEIGHTQYHRFLQLS